jgi:hypothetical protein
MRAFAAHEPGIEVVVEDAQFERLLRSDDGTASPLQGPPWVITVHFLPTEKLTLPTPVHLVRSKEVTLRKIVVFTRVHWGESIFATRKGSFVARFVLGFANRLKDKGRAEEVRRASSEPGAHRYVIPSQEELRDLF